MQVMATICEELPPDSVVLVYLSASGLHFPRSSSINNQFVGLVLLCYVLVTLMITHTGKAGLNNVSQMESSEGSSKSRHKVFSQSSQQMNSGTTESQNNGQREMICHDSCLWFGPKGNSGRYLH